MKQEYPHIQFKKHLRLDEIFSDISTRLQTNKDTQEGLVTFLAALVSIARETSRSDPASILRELCVVAASSAARQSAATRALTMQAATRIAQILRIASLKALFEEYLSLLLSAWFNASQSLEDFPFYMLGCDDLTQFLQRYKQK